MDIESIIYNILSLPTAPFRESWVRARIRAFAKVYGIPHFVDDVGNVWLNTMSYHEAAQAKYILVSHMDHPGIQIDEYSNGVAEGVWLGGGTMRIVGQPVTLFANSYKPLVTYGRVIDANESETHPGRPGNVLIELQDPTSKVLMPFGQQWGAVLTLPEIPGGVLRVGDDWLCRAADDLMSVSVMLQVLRTVRQKGYVVLFTIGEEMDLTGTAEVLSRHAKEVGTAPVMLSIETANSMGSATTPGNGPIVRYGDAKTRCTITVVESILAVAEKCAKENPNFCHQIQGSSHGTTEALSFKEHGFDVGGISLSIENEHNYDNIDFKIKPERVSASDVLAMTQLIENLVR